MRAAEDYSPPPRYWSPFCLFPFLFPSLHPEHSSELVKIFEFRRLSLFSERRRGRGMLVPPRAHSHTSYPDFLLPRESKAITTSSLLPSLGVERFHA